MKEYATDEIVVEWDPRLCYHSHNCVRALPQVFDPDGRPWVVWRIARKFDTGVVRQVSEADVRNSVVLVFKATGNGTTTVAFGLTRGETSKAYESRRFLVRVR